MALGSSTLPRTITTMVLVLILAVITYNIAEGTMKIEDGSAFKEWQRWQDACQRVQLLTARRTAPPRWQRVWNHLRQIRIRIHWKFTWTLLAAVALFLAAEWVMMQRYQPVERGVVFDRLANRYCGFDPMYLRWGCTPSLNQGGTNAR